MQINISLYQTSYERKLRFPTYILRGDATRLLDFTTYDFLATYSMEIWRFQSKPVAKIPCKKNKVTSDARLCGKKMMKKLSYNISKH